MDRNVDLKIMQKQILYLLILATPFLAMMLVNEWNRTRIQEEGYKIKGVIAMNSVEKMSARCSWICHNNTEYCRDNHVKWLDKYASYTDPIYIGTIQSLKATGNYRLANILFFVILMPFILYCLLIKCIDLQIQIKALKSRR